MKVDIPDGLDDCEVKCGKRKVAVTNLKKIFWPELGKTKRDLLLYYAAVSDVLLPHLKDRAIVFKRYPEGVGGKSILIKRSPTHHPWWFSTCPISYTSGSTVEFPMLQDCASLLWSVNFGCIDMNPWYARCDNTDLPDYLNFDLDPIAPAGFQEVREAALLIRKYLASKDVACFAKTSGSQGIHVYVPLQRRATQKQVWLAAKRLALDLVKRSPELLTAEYRVTKRPLGRVFLDYNQNSQGKTLASAYSVRPVASGTVSAPITWEEIEKGVSLSDFTMDTMPSRIERMGDLFRPLLRPTFRCPLETLQ